MPIQDGSAQKKQQPPLAAALSPLMPLEQYSDFFDMILQYDLATGTPDLPPPQDLPACEQQAIIEVQQESAAQTSAVQTASHAAIPPAANARASHRFDRMLDLAQIPSPVHGSGSGSGSGSGPSSRPEISGPSPSVGPAAAFPVLDLSEPHTSPCSVSHASSKAAAPFGSSALPTVTSSGGMPVLEIDLEGEARRSFSQLTCQEAGLKRPPLAPSVAPLGLTFDPSVYDVAPLPHTSPQIAASAIGRGAGDLAGSSVAWRDHRVSSSGGALIFTSGGGPRFSWDGGPVVALPPSHADVGAGVKGQAAAGSGMDTMKHTPHEAAIHGWGYAAVPIQQQHLPGNIAGCYINPWFSDAAHHLQHQQHQNHCTLDQIERHIQELAAESAEAAMHVSTALCMNAASLLHQQQQQQYSLAAAGRGSSSGIFSPRAAEPLPPSLTEDHHHHSSMMMMIPHSGVGDEDDNHSSMQIPGLLPGDLDPAEEEDLEYQRGLQTSGGGYRGDLSRPVRYSYRAALAAGGSMGGGSECPSGGGLLELPAAAEAALVAAAIMVPTPGMDSNQGEGKSRGEGGKM